MNEGIGIMSKFVIEEGKYGSRMVVKAKWSRRITEYCLRNNIRELCLNIAHGWPGNDLSFLGNLKELLSLDILTDYVEDTSGINQLSRLRSLSVGVFIKNEIDFSTFPDLEEVYLDWSPKVKSLFDCKSLKKVLVCKYKSKSGDLSDFSRLPNL